MAALALGCTAGPIAWGDALEEPATSPTNYGMAREQGGRTHRDSTKLRPPVTPGQCTASVQVWRDEAGVAYAAWWALRPDSTADIVASATTDGGSWSAPARLDTADAGRVGCNRPPPAIAGDGDNLQVVYAMRAREGPGIFLAHSMDRARTFHSPVAVVYGEKLGLASVSAAGNFVIVAYEDPNTTPTRISIALSTTMAHLFEYREVISPEDVAASRPLVYTDGKRVELSWSRAGSDSTRRIVRRGTVR